MAKRQKEDIQEEEKYKGRVKKLQWRRFKTATILTIIVGIIGGVILYVAISGLIIRIEPDNYCPLITSVPNVTAEVGKLYTYQVKAEDYDGDTLRYSIEVDPRGIGKMGDGIKIDDVSGLVTWNVPDNPYKQVYLKIEVTDGKLRYLQTFILTVEYGKSVPIIDVSTKPPLVVIQNEQYKYLFKIIDKDRDKRPKFDLNLSAPRKDVLLDIDKQNEDDTWDAYLFFKVKEASKYERVYIHVLDGNSTEIENLYSYIVYDVWVKPQIDINILYILLIIGIILIAGVCYDFYRMYGY